MALCAKAINSGNSLSATVLMSTIFEYSKVKNGEKEKKRKKKCALGEKKKKIIIIIILQTS